jgi:hypothetical protein
MLIDAFLERLDAAAQLLAIVRGDEFLEEGTGVRGARGKAGGWGARGEGGKEGFGGFEEFLFEVSKE